MVNPSTFPLLYLTWPSSLKFTCPAHFVGDNLATPEVVFAFLTHPTKVWLFPLPKFQLDSLLHRLKSVALLGALKNVGFFFHKRYICNCLSSVADKVETCVLSSDIKEHVWPKMLTVSISLSHSSNRCFDVKWFLDYVKTIDVIA